MSCATQYEENNMRTVELEHLRPGEVLEELERCPIAYLPAGPIEWHNPANPLGVDAFIGRETAIEAAKRTGGVVFPTLFLGSDCPRPRWHLEKLGFDNVDQYIVGMDFPNLPMKSYYYPVELVSVMLSTTVEMLIEHGYKLIVVLNAHGSATQNTLVDEMCLKYSNRSNALVINGMRSNGRKGKPMMKADADISQSKVGHANISETSMMLRIAPEDVDLSQLPADRSVGLRYQDYGIVDRCVLFGDHPGNGCVVNDPRDSTREYGAQLLEDAVACLVENVQEAYASLISKS